MTYLQAAIAQKKQFVRPSAAFATIPAPVAGWNVRDSLESMDPRFATILDNYIPRTGYVELRQGNTLHADTGETVSVEFLHEFRGADRQLIAAAADKVFNVTSTPATLGSGFTSSQWVGENFNNRTFIVNGVDVAQFYDGTTLGPQTWTFAVAGPATTLSDLKYVHQTKRRLMFAANGLSGFWYGPVDAITGELAYFPLEFVAPGSGQLRAIGTFTLDGGDLGVDDLVGFFMDTGDVIVYSGTDPADAAAWNLVGRFKVGEPIGNKPLVPWGGDLIAITPTGFQSVLAGLKSGQREPTISDAIIGAVKDAVALYRNNFGWSIQLYPAEQLLLFNIPTGSIGTQYVMNTATQAWCPLKNLNIVTMSLFDDELYMGTTDGKVIKYGGGDDRGEAIIGDAQTAWNDFGRQGLNKRFVMYRPIMSSDGPLNISMGLGVDFQNATVSAAAPSEASAGGQWDVDNWDVATWGGGETFSREWQGTDRRGDHAAIRITTNTKGQFIRWYSTDLQYTPSGPR